MLSFPTDNKYIRVKQLIMKKYKFGQGFDKYSRKQLSIYWFCIGFSVGVSFVFVIF